jgi:hypothetical protein
VICNKGLIYFQEYPILKEHVIELVADACHNQYEEDKISSSSLRKRFLGTVINPIKVSITYMIH